MAKVNRYSLTDHIVTIKIPNTNGILKGVPEDLAFSIGGPGETGQGSFVGSIKVTRNKEAFTTDGDVTGSWVHNRNLDKTGTVSIEIKQVSNTIIKLIKICNAYESIRNSEDMYFGGFEGLTITVSDSTGNQFINCTDCMITKIPDQNFGETAELQTWEFTCGYISYDPVL